MYTLSLSNDGIWHERILHLSMGPRDESFVNFLTPSLPSQSHYSNQYKVFPLCNCAYFFSKAFLFGSLPNSKRIHGHKKDLLFIIRESRKNYSSWRRDNGCLCKHPSAKRTCRRYDPFDLSWNLPWCIWSEDFWSAEELFLRSWLLIRMWSCDKELVPNLCGYMQSHTKYLLGKTEQFVGWCWDRVDTVSVLELKILLLVFCKYTLQTTHSCGTNILRGCSVFWSELYVCCQLPFFL